MQHKHLTIMFTDIKGFTSRTSRSSREQLKQLLVAHDKLILPVFKKFTGTVIKTIGDAFMVTFNSPTDAVLCGMAIQKILNKHNAEQTLDERIQVRVAINSGEVTIKDNDVFGDAVNIAARLEGVADAGDIFFTESVYLSMNKNEIPTAEVGYKRFKGIPEEVKVYKVLKENKPSGVAKTYKPTPTIAPITPGQPKKKLISNRGLGAIAIIAIIFFIFVGIANSNKNQPPQGLAIYEDSEIAEEQELKDHLEILYKETNRAIDNNNKLKALNILKELHQLNNDHDLHEQLDPHLEKLEQRFADQFGEDSLREELLERFNIIEDKAWDAIENQHDEELARRQIDNLHRIKEELNMHEELDPRVIDLENTFEDEFN